MIIGISGKMGSGKTTLATHLTNMLGGRKVSFADELRYEVAEYFQVPMEVMTDRNCKEVVVVPVGYQYMTVRQLMQWWGGIRRQEDPDYWVKKLVGSATDELIVIDDVRYKNEAEIIKASGGILIRLQTYDGWKSGAGEDHPSEVDLDEFSDFDGVFWPTFGGLAEVASIVREKLGEV